MSIIFRYYRTGRDGYYESPGKMILSRNTASFPDEQVPEGEFSYSPVKTLVEIRDKSRHRVNFLFTELKYGKGQREMMANLGWVQRQKLRWMYRDHWLQRPGNLRHFLVILLIISLLTTGVIYFELSELF